MRKVPAFHNLDDAFVVNEGNRRNNNVRLTVSPSWEAQSFTIMCVCVRMCGMISTWVRHSQKWGDESPELPSTQKCILKSAYKKLETQMTHNWLKEIS